MSEDADTATLANGIVSATVKKANGNLLSLRFRGVELLSRGGGYWNIYGEHAEVRRVRNSSRPLPFSASAKIRQRTAARWARSRLRFPYRGQPKAVPLDIEIRYTLHRGDCGPLRMDHRRP